MPSVLESPAWRPETRVKETSGWGRILEGQYRLPWRIHPGLLFGLTWLGVASLYSLRLSSILVFPLASVWRISVIVITAFGLASFAFTRFPPRKPHRVDPNRAWNRILLLFACWLAVNTFEAFYSGGLPVLWLLEHSAKNYLDFGLPTLHGFDDSLLAALALACMFLFLAVGKIQLLAIPAFALVWSGLIINRDLIVVIAIESSILLLVAVRPKLRHVAVLLAAAFIGIWLFGIIGDFRSGHAAFVVLAHPSPNYPRWLPSGFLWGYIYLTASVNNLLLNLYALRPLGSWYFPNTVALLLPTVIREVVYKNLALVTNGIILTQAFNTSTAFVGPYIDMGETGIALFAAAMGMWCGWFWRGRGAVQTLSYAVLAQCAALSMFYNHFFYLPVIFQLFWIRLIFPRFRAEPTRS